MFKVLFFFIFDVVQHSLLKFLAHYLLGNFSIFPKGGRSSSIEVPALDNPEITKSVGWLNRILPDKCLGFLDVKICRSMQF